MAKKVEIKTEYECSVNEFIFLTSDPGLHEFLARQPDFSHRDVKDFKQEGRIWTWNVQVEINDQLPSAIQAVLGGLQLRWQQFFEFDLDTRILKIRVVHPLPRSVLDVQAWGQISGVTDHRCAVVLHMDVTSQVPVLGPRIEALACDKVSQKWMKDSVVRADYIALCRKEGKILIRQEGVL